MQRGTGGGRGLQWWSAVLALVVVAGCSRMDGRIPVTGTLMIDGTPAAGVYMRFYASLDTKGNGGYAYTDEAGRFTATTLQSRPGLYPGEYAVTLEPPTEGPGQARAVANPAKIPGGYGNPETTPLNMTVTGPRADVVLQATSGAK